MSLRMNRLAWKPGKQIESRGPRDAGAVLLGNRLLTKMLLKRGLCLSGDPRTTLAPLLFRYGSRSVEDLYAAIVAGTLPASKVVADLVEISR